MWKRYLSLLQKRPILTNAITAGVIGGTGDAAAQQLDSVYVKKTGLLPVTKLNYRRLSQVALWGFAWLGAPMYWWFRILDRWFPPGIVVSGGE